MACRSIASTSRPMAHSSSRPAIRSGPRTSTPSRASSWRAAVPRARPPTSCSGGSTGRSASPGRRRTRGCARCPRLAHPAQVSAGLKVIRNFSRSIDLEFAWSRGMPSSPPSARGGPADPDVRVLHDQVAAHRDQLRVSLELRLDVGLRVVGVEDDRRSAGRSEPRSGPGDRSRTSAEVGDPRVPRVVRHRRDIDRDHLPEPRRSHIDARKKALPPR